MAVRSLGDLHDLAVGVLKASKTSHENAVSVANALVKAAADGLASHGVARLPAFSAQAITGDFRRASPEDNNERQSIHEHLAPALAVAP